jgi:hypothetical protein
MEKTAAAKTPSVLFNEGEKIEKERGRTELKKSFLRE